MAATEEEIISVGGLGQVIASSVRAWSTDPDNITLVEKLQAAGVSVEDEAPEAGSDLLAGVTIVITGTLAGMSREAAEAAVVALGGKAASSVSRKTSALVAGENPGASKVQKAEESGVLVIDESRFQRLLDKGPIALE